MDFIEEKEELTINKDYNSISEAILKKIDSDSIDGYQFERIISKILLFNGFVNVRITKASGDYGIDIFAEKEDISYAIQCKCYSNPVGNKAIQEVYTGKTFYKKMVAAVITNNTFTKSAMETAERTQVLLWDRKKLIEMINKIPENNLIKLANNIGIETVEFQPKITYSIIEINLSDFMNSGNISETIENILYINDSETLESEKKKLKVTVLNPLNLLKGFFAVITENIQLEIVNVKTEAVTTEMQKMIYTLETVLSIIGLFFAILKFQDIRTESGCITLLIAFIVSPLGNSLINGIFITLDTIFLSILKGILSILNNVIFRLVIQTFIVIELLVNFNMV